MISCLRPVSKFMAQLRLLAPKGFGLVGWLVLEGRLAMAPSVGPSKQKEAEHTKLRILIGYF